MTLLAGLLSMSLALAPFDEVVEGWVVWETGGECVMASEFEGGTMVSVALDWRTKRIRIVLSDDEWASLGARDGEELRADFELFGRNVEYDQWWSESAMIIGSTEKKIFGVTAWWDGEKHGEEFWPAWALADGVEIKIDGKIIGRFDLEGTYKATLALHRCAAVSLRDDRSDPFAR